MGEEWGKGHLRDATGSNTEYRKKERMESVYQRRNIREKAERAAAQKRREAGCDTSQSCENGTPEEVKEFHRGSLFP